MIKEGAAIRDLYPDYVEAGSVYEFLAAGLPRQGRQGGGHRGARSATRRSAGAIPESLKKLAKTLEEAGRKKEAAARLNRLNFIYPVDDEAASAASASLWLEQGNVEGRHPRISPPCWRRSRSIRRRRITIWRGPITPDKQDEQAKEEVLAALEAAPGLPPGAEALARIEHYRRQELETDKTCRQLTQIGAGSSEERASSAFARCRARSWRRSAG